MQNEFNQLPKSISDQLERLIVQLRTFANENATSLSFDNYASISELANQGELYRQCIEQNDWKPVVTGLLNEGNALIRFLQKDTATTPATAELNG